MSMSLASIIIILLVFFSCIAYILYVVYKPSSKSRHWSSIPGFCMGVGIAGTFISLFWTFQNYDEKQSLSMLIKDVSSAFIGSLVGLIFSLLMTYYIKSKISSIEEEEQKKAKENGEDNPYKLLQQIVENTKNNNGELEKLNTAFSTFNERGEKLNKDMLNEFSKKFEELMTSVKEDAIGQSLSNLEKIQGQLSAELKKIFGTTNSTISEGQNALTDGINALTVALENKIDAVNQQTIGSAKKAEETIQKTIETIQANVEAKVGDINTNIEKIEKTTQNFGDNISVELEKVLKSKIESLEKAFDKIEEYQRRSQTILETTTNSFKETVDKYEQVNEDKTGLIDIIGKQLAELQAVRENGTELISHWEQIATSMECMQERINKINGVIAQLDNIKTVLANQQN